VYYDAGQEEDDDEEIDDTDYHSPKSAYKKLKLEFGRIEEEKRKAFREGNYENIDVSNALLLRLEKKLSKLEKILFPEEEEEES